MPNLLRRRQRLRCNRFKRETQTRGARAGEAALELLRLIVITSFGAFPKVFTGELPFNDPR